MPVGRDRADDRHEVDDLPDAGLGHEPGDQNRSVREVQLLAGEDVHRRTYPEVAATAMVQQCSEDAGGVEAGCAEPVDGSIGGHERRGLEVTDESVVGDERVVRHEPRFPSGRLERPCP